MPSDLAHQVIARARELGMHVATAESLTGGLVSSALVAVPGASQVFSGGIVAYDTALKATLLGVDPALLDAVGPVDAEVARQMAAGARAACGSAEYGVATTGVAGPSADPQTGSPVGTVWIGVSSSRGERAVLLESYGGDRETIRARATQGALAQLLEELTS